LLSAEGFTSRSSSAVWKPAETSSTRTAGHSGKLTTSRCLSKSGGFLRSCSRADPEPHNAARPDHARQRGAQWMTFNEMCFVVYKLNQE
jgi:hypothetical protein